jgi:pimeloyl-ACP methyl ester carboxylesterase
MKYIRKNAQFTLIQAILFTFLYIGVPSTAFATIIYQGPPDTSNVLFIPGTLTSRLYTRDSNGKERELWEPRSNADIGPLELSATSTSKSVIYTRDIVDRLYSNDPIYGLATNLQMGSGADAYGPFADFMNTLVSQKTIQAWKAFPYDWRYDATSVVANGTLIGNATGPITTDRLQNEIRSLASTSQSGKVTIIAHSNGGLIAKALAIDLKKKGELNLIDHIIFVGTPQLGTPKAIASMIHGSEFTELGGLLMYGNSVRLAEKTMPGPYDLLPSSAYFSHESSPVVSFDTVEPAATFRKAFGSLISSQQKLTDFLSDRYKLDKVAGLPASTKTPIPLSPLLLERAATLHTTLDAWTPSSSLAVTAIAGWGMLTPYQTSYTGTGGLTCDKKDVFGLLSCSFNPQIQGHFLFTENGDDTVITRSAVGLSTTTYYLNEAKLQKETGTKIAHNTLLNAASVQLALKNILEHSTVNQSYVSIEEPISDTHSFTVVSVHSPMNIIARDSAGNRTGIIPLQVQGLTGIYFQKNDIPGSSVQTIGDEKYLYLPPSDSYDVSLQGYDTGSTTIEIGSYNSSDYHVAAQFSDIQTSASTSGELTLGPNAQSPNAIAIDLLGTGSTTLIVNSLAIASTSGPHDSASVLYRKWLAAMTPLTRAQVVIFLQRLFLKTVHF